MVSTQYVHVSTSKPAGGSKAARFPSKRTTPNTHKSLSRFVKVSYSCSVMFKKVELFFFYNDALFHAPLLTSLACY